MARNSGVGILPLALAGLAAWGYYKYSKMSEEQKKNLVSDLKQKGQKFYDENIPMGLPPCMPT